MSQDYIHCNKLIKKKRKKGRGEVEGRKQEGEEGRKEGEREGGGERMKKHITSLGLIDET